MILNTQMAQLRASPITRIFRTHRRQRLVRNYFFISVVLMAGGLITAGSLEIYFRYREGLQQVGLAQQDAANAAALKIEKFIQDIATTMTASSKSADISSLKISRQYEFELKRLLVLAPAITEALALDVDGVIQAQTSRFRAASPLLKTNLAQSAPFRESKQGKSFFRKVYLRDSDPYLTLAVPIEKVQGNVIGVILAEASLRDILDVVSSVKLGKGAYGYVVTRSGDLIAHSNFGLVRQRRNLSQLDYVRAAFEPTVGAPRPEAIVTRNIEGRKVFSSYALVPLLNWAVFIERPVEEAYQPIYASLFRTAILILVGLGVALLASLVVRRRVVRPLETLRQGVKRIGSGDLSTRLEIKTGDEIESLAEEFNKMTAHLKEAQSGLERKVAERTQALTIANEKLEESSKLKSQFLANVNHELRTPLSSIIGYARLLRRETEGQISPLQRENLDDLLGNAQRLLRLIDGLLDFAKIESGKLEARVEPVKVEELIHGAAAIIEPMLNKDTVRLTRDIEPDGAVVYTDPEMLRQIILNLLGNAAKFTDRGEIKISACHENGDLKLAVADTGIGIDQADLTKIFDEFDRGSLATNGSYRGTGLGLAIVKRLVEVLGGSIFVKSDLGKGSTFTVRLPVHLHTTPPV